MKYLPSYLLALLILLSASNAASEVTNQYLNQALHASPYQLERITAESSWFDKPELRYSGSDEDEHGIAFRFQPRFAPQRLAENRIIDLLNHRQAHALGARLNDELKPRYHALIELIETYNELAYLEQKVVLDQQKLALNRSLAETEAFRIADLQSAEFEYHSNRRLLDQFVKRLNFRLRGFTGIPADLLEEFLSTWSQQVSDWGSFIGTGNQLIHLVDSDQFDDAAGRVDYQLARQKLSLARSDSASWLEFVELKLVDRPSGEQEATLAISIPLGRNDFGISQRVAEVNRANLSLQGNRLDISRSITGSVAELEWMQDQAMILKSGETLLKQQYEKLRSIAQPAVALKLKSEILSYQNELRRLHIRGLRGYIELLHLAGYLAKQPLTNWLLRTQPKL
ncbi:MAG: hypothetical protein KJP11_10475 [Gammaproteobacteria bacterium]|nr:hypothetical protein [Gammaproteobacteria bacterium]